MSSNDPVYSVAIPVHVLRDGSISATAKLLYGIIDSFQKKSGVCFASNDRLSEELGGCTPRTASKCLGELREAGYIITDDEKGRKIYLSTSAPDGQGGRSFLPPPTKKTSTQVEENFQGGGRNFPQSNTLSDNNIPPNPPEGGGSRGKKSGRGQQTKAQADVLPDRFDGFWKFYRDHVPPDRNAGNRQKALRAWDQLAPTDEQVTLMAKALAEQVRTQAWISGIGVPHASTWLNNRGWEDDWGAAGTQSQTAGADGEGRAEEWLN